MIINVPPENTIKRKNKINVTFFYPIVNTQSQCTLKNAYR